VSNVLTFNLGRAFSGHRLAYIYVIFSKASHVLYVGHTSQRGGPLCRLGQHLGDGENATFRQKLWTRDESSVEDIDDLELYAFPLPEEAAYLSIDRSYREGVEYLLQKRLESEGARWKPYFDVVSEVRAPSTTSLAEIQAQADRFFNLVEVFYKLPAI